MGIKNRLLYLAGRGHLARALHAEVVPTKWSEFRVRVAAGQEIYCHLHRPAGSGIHPGVVIVPGANNPGTAYDHAGVLTADEIACLGFAVVHYDPCGRGKSGGTEDFWGPTQQQELADILWHVNGLDCVDSAFGLTVFSFSIGIIIATGALRREGLPTVRMLFDWEGPSDRYIITRNDRHRPLRDYPTSLEEFWSLREPVNMIGGIRCGYFRYQAERDHVQGDTKTHALALVNAATSGHAAWTRLNDNPPNKLFDMSRPDLPLWVPASKNHRETILGSFLSAFHSTDGANIPICPA